MSNLDNKRVWIEFFTPNQIKTFELPPNLILVGDAHIQRGAFCVIGGPPGVGKSRAAFALAISGATGNDWMDLPVQQKFRTMIIQTENGKSRLKGDFETINCGDFEQWIRICSPPPFGLAFECKEFVEELRKRIEEFKPDVVIFDPWNSIAGDDKQSDYLTAFNTIRSVVDVSDNGAAVVIVAHTRKPRDDEKASGRELIHLLSGSHVLVSVPRSVFVMVPESSEVESDKIIFTCCKNNDGEMNSPSIYIRKNLDFEYVSDVDPNRKHDNKRKSITLDDMRTLFEKVPLALPRLALLPLLMKQTEAKKSTCYAALAKDGKFKDYLEYDELNNIKWKV